MKIPKFKPSDVFLGEFKCPCLVAKVKNSELPNVATRYIAEHRRNPTCQIYLRERDPGKISDWSQNILEQLFEREGLSSALNEGMNEYETSSKWGGDEGYSDLTEEEKRVVQEQGIAAYMTVSDIVIDEIKREVIISADTEVDLNLVEHGITIYLQKSRWPFTRKNRWRFSQADYFIDYLAEIESEGCERIA